MQEADDPECLLIILANVDAKAWVASAGNAGKGAESLRKAMEALIAFVRAFELLHAGNRAIILTVSSSGHYVAYPSSMENGIPDSELRGKHGDHWRDDDLDRALPDAVRSCTAGDPEGEKAPRLASALARALCLINRTRSTSNANGTNNSASTSAGTSTSKFSARILTLLAGADDPSQYVSVMNCIFSAQYLEVPIDSCVVGGTDAPHSTYFQQAAFLTKGIYFRPENQHALLQTLLTIFLPDPISRDLIAMPVPDEVDFRASCFDTRKVIDNGFTCSVCLSSFDGSVKNSAMCPVCNARFAVTGKRRAGRR